MATPALRRKEEEPPIERLLLPVQEFIHAEASSGIVLIIFTIIALLWANSPWLESYYALWLTKLNISLGNVGLNKALILWINDGLMAIFFFVVGLEIKREVMVGELRSFKQAALPIMAAIGGMLAPALIFTIFNFNQAGAAGWGIPMATDIAFALGVLALVGKRAPLSLKIFLTALAIVDDIGAVLVIALFYTVKISWLSLGLAFVFLLLMFAANRLGVRHPLVYGILGILLWVAFLKSGIHATVAGVLAAMTIPARTRINTKQFLKDGRFFLEKFEDACLPGKSILTNRRQRAAVQALKRTCRRAESPMQRLEHTLHPWVAFAIVPIFALSNAGVTLQGDLLPVVTHPIALGVFFGLIAGKQIGITFFTWLAVKTGLGEMPDDLTWRHIYGASWLASIGFTMSIFVGNLAYKDLALLNTAKTGILAASVLAGSVGWLILRGSRPAQEKG